MALIDRIAKIGPAFKRTVQKFDNYSLTEEQQQRFEPLKTTVEDIDFESCNELLDAWLSDIR